MYQNSFENYLHRHDEVAWSAARNKLLPAIHEVDSNATQIWFKFYPLALAQAFEAAEDKKLLAQRLLIKGDYGLADKIDSSHTFLYGHRFWPDVKKAIEAHAQSFLEHEQQELAENIRAVAGQIAERIKVDPSLLIGITAVAFMTVQQAGLDAFKAATGTVHIQKRRVGKSAKDVLRLRAKDDSQGLLGFLRTVDKQWTVTYDENESGSSFRLMNDEELASAAARDSSRDWTSRDSRCIEGPIPVECRAASCGTCWVGVLGGAEKLTDVARLEGKKIKEFGYIETDESKPLIRLACMARASGAVSIVIPPWNGVFGKYLKAGDTDTEEAPSVAASEAASSNGAGK